MWPRELTKQSIVCCCAPSPFLHQHQAIVCVPCEPNVSEQHAGVVYWAPPEAALRRAAEALREPLVSAYGPCGGMPALVAALKRKLADENGLSGVRRLQHATQ